MIYGIKPWLCERLNLDAEQVDKHRDLKVDDDRDKSFINEPQGKTNNPAPEGNGDLKDTGQQLVNQVENFVQNGRNINLHNSRNEEEDELDEFEDNLLGRSNQLEQLKTRKDVHMERTSSMSLATPLRSERSPPKILRILSTERPASPLRSSIAGLRIPLTPPRTGVKTPAVTSILRLTKQYYVNDKRLRMQELKKLTDFLDNRIMAETTSVSEDRVQTFVLSGVTTP